MLKKPAILFAGLLVAGLFVFGLVRLFALRYEQGDIYPPYSTLRADPLGASVFSESLDRLPGVSAGPYFERTLQEEQGAGRTLFVLGSRPYGLAYMSRTEYQTLRQFVFNGGRVVVGYFPEPKQTWSSREEEKELTEEKKKAENKAKPEKKERRKKRGDRSKKSDKDDDEEDWRKELKFVNLHDEWGFRPAFRSATATTNETTKVRRQPFGRKSAAVAADKPREPLPEDEELEINTAKLTLTNSTLPASLAVHTALYFSRLTNGWTEIYADGKYPVVVERRFGKGSVVLVADSYPFSNEAMLKDRSAPLLAWMLGGGREAIFDEAHLGVVADPGIAALMRKYRLHGLLFSLLILALLFIWKNALSLVPPHAGAETEAGPVVYGKDSAAGFVNLLRRGIPPAEILNACYVEWGKACARRAAVAPAQWQEVHQLVQQQQAREASARTPVQTYRAISKILKRKNQKNS